MHEAEDLREAGNAVREVHLVAVGNKHEESEQVKNEEREDNVEGWKVWDHADLHGWVDEGEEDATSEDGDQDEEGGEKRHYGHAVMAVTQSLETACDWKRGRIVQEKGGFSCGAGWSSEFDPGLQDSKGHVEGLEKQVKQYADKRGYKTVQEVCW